MDQRRQLLVGRQSIKFNYFDAPRNLPPPASQVGIVLSTSAVVRQQLAQYSKRPTPSTPTAAQLRKQQSVIIESKANAATNQLAASAPVGVQQQNFVNEEQLTKLANRVIEYFGKDRVPDCWLQITKELKLDAEAFLGLAECYLQVSKNKEQLTHVGCVAENIDDPAEAALIASLRASVLITPAYNLINFKMADKGLLGYAKETFEILVVEQAKQYLANQLNLKLLRNLAHGIYHSFTGNIKAGTDGNGEYIRDPNTLAKLSEQALEFDKKYHFLQRMINAMSAEWRAFFSDTFSIEKCGGHDLYLILRAQVAGLIGINDKDEATLPEVQQFLQENHLSIHYFYSFVVRFVAQQYLKQHYDHLLADGVELDYSQALIAPGSLPAALPPSPAVSESRKRTNSRTVSSSPVSSQLSNSSLSSGLMSASSASIRSQTLSPIPEKAMPAQLITAPSGMTVPRQQATVHRSSPVLAQYRQPPASSPITAGLHAVKDVLTGALAKLTS